MDESLCVKGLEKQKLNHALEWLKARQGKLLGARLALDAFYNREPENDGFRAPLSDADVDWHGYSHGAIRELLVPMADRKTLYQCRERGRKLIKAAAAHLELGHWEQAEDCENELRAISAYLSEVTAPGGRIRNFPASRVKNYQADMQAWYYLLRKAEEDDPGSTLSCWPMSARNPLPLAGLNPCQGWGGRSAGNDGAPERETNARKGTEP